MAAHADPMKSLNSMTRGSATAASDTTPELSTPFMVPPMIPQAPPPAQRPPMPAPVPPRAAPPAQPIPPAATIPPTQTYTSGFGGPPGTAGAPRQRAAAPGGVPVGAADAAAPPGAVLSWNDPSGESRTVIRPRGGVPAPGAGAFPDALDLSLDFGAPAPAPVAPPAPRSAASAAGAPGDGAGAAAGSAGAAAGRRASARTAAGAHDRGCAAWQPPPNVAALPAPRPGTMAAAPPDVPRPLRLPAPTSPLSPRRCAKASACTACRPRPSS
jgi:hypothetical protein